MHAKIPYKNCVYNCLPEDELKRLEICRSLKKIEELN
jgi:hypothetical protein